jgi:alkylation response protein AidB-like acyl-CoA dehydrogenase
MTIRFEDSETQKILRSTARAYLAERFPYERLYAIEQGAEAIEPAEFASMGWHALLAPESAGGGGLSLLEAAVVIEELGYAAVPAPVLTSNIAADLLDSADPGQHLASLASGAKRYTVSFSRKHRTGEHALVPFARESDVLVTSLAIDGRPAFVAVPLDGLALDEVRLMHATATCIRIDAIPIDPATVLATGADAEALRERGEALTTALLLIELAGAMQRILSMTSQYISNRVQFGQPIAKFQAARHRAAELLMQADTTRWAAYHALWRFQNDPTDTREIWLTKHWAARAADRVFQHAHMLHGGVGVGMEYPLHLYTLRMSALAVLGGTMPEMVERTASLLVGNPT